MRQFVLQNSPDKNGLIELQGKDFRYLKQVLRLKVGDMLVVRLLDGTLKNSTVCKIDDKKKAVTIQLCADISSNEGNLQNQSSYSAKTNFVLFQFVPKALKMDLIVRQACECGISKIIPIAGQFCQGEKNKNDLRASRYERIIKEARQQSGSPISTEITATVTVNDACSIWKNIVAQNEKENCFACVLYERTDKTKALHFVLSQYKEIKNCAIVCGAEGGISPEEIEEFISAGFIPLHFDTNILRCETAALYGIACVQNAVAEKNIWQLKE